MRKGQDKHIFRRFLRISVIFFTLLIFWWSEGGVYSLSVMAVLLGISSLPVCVAAFIIAFSFPYRYNLHIPLIDTLIQIQETGHYTFIPLFGMTVLPFTVSRKLCFVAPDSIHTRVLLQKVLKWLRRLCFTGMLIMLGAMLYRSFPLPESTGWMLIFLSYGISLSPRQNMKSGLAALRRYGPSSMLLFLSILISLMLVEGGVRLLLENPPRENELFEAHPEAIFALSPGSESTAQRRDNDGGKVSIPFRISSQGWREEELGAKGGNEFRILMLGDSFTMGYSTTREESIPHQLERFLAAEKLPFNIRVINAGVNGSGPWQQRIYLEERGFPLKPDLVIHEIFPPNDIENSLEPIGKKFQAWNPGWHQVLDEYRRWHSFPVQAERFLRHHFHAWYYLSRLPGCDNLLYRMLESTRLNPERRVPEFNMNEERPFYFETNLKEWYPELEEGFGRMASDILAISRECRKQQVDYIAWCAPGTIQFDKESVDLQNRIHGDIYDLRKPFAVTEAFFEKSDIPWFSVLPALQKAGTLEELYYLNDGHYTAEGCQVVAGAIRDWLMENYFPEKFPEMM